MFWQIVDLISPLLGILAILVGVYPGSQNTSALFALLVAGPVLVFCFCLAVSTPVDFSGVPSKHVALESVRWFFSLGLTTGSALGNLGGAIAHRYGKLSRKGA